MLRTVRSKLILGIVVPLILVYGTVVFFDTRSDIKKTLDTTEVLMRESVKIRAAHCDKEFFKIAGVLTTVLDFFADNPRPEKFEIYALFSRILRSNPELFSLGCFYAPEAYAPDKPLYEIFSYRGKDATILVTDPENGYDYQLDDWYLITSRLNRQYWTEPYIGQIAGEISVCTCAVPFYHDGKLMGILRADLTLNEVRRIVQENTPEDSRFCLVSSTGKIISDSVPELEMRETLYGLAEWYNRKDIADWARETLQSDYHFSRVVPIQDELDPKASRELSWVVATPLREPGWTLLVMTRESVIWAPIYANLLRRIGVFLIGLLLIVSAIVIVSSRIGTAVERLAEFADELAEGNLDAQVRSGRRNDELGRLANRFDQMIVRLKSYVDQQMQESLAREAMEEEFRLARRIQASLLPRNFPPFPDRTEFDLHALTEPAAHIAGDFFDFFFMDEKTLGIVIADVSGHGIPAAMFMAVSRTVLRNFSSTERSAGAIIRQTNRVLTQDNDDDMFVTLFFGCYDIETGRLTYVNAGLNPPYILRKDGSLDKLDSTGTMLALDTNAEFEERVVQLDFGDVLVAYTDGVTGAHEQQRTDHYGEERLESLLKKVRHYDVTTICDIVFKDTDTFSRGERHDDITLLVLKRN